MFAMYRRANSFEQLTRSVKYFVNRVREFQAAPVACEEKDWWNDSGNNKEAQLLVWLNARVKNIEARIDTLAGQLSELTLNLKKGSSKRILDCGDDKLIEIEVFENGCLFCKMPRHGANTCLNNPNRDTSCINCGKMRHGPEICWDKPWFVPQQIDQAEGNRNHVALINDGDQNSSLENESV